jgi:signal transduction histidine kinase
MLRIFIFILSLSQETIGTEEIVLITYVVFFVLFLSVVFVIFFLTFQRRKNQLLIDKINQQKAFDEELIKTQQEIQEETLKHIGRELHDNVGQMLSYANMQLNSVIKNAGEAVKPKAKEVSFALKESLEEVRSLSKSLNSDVIFYQGFEAILTNEVKRLNKLAELNVDLKVEGERRMFENKNDEIILFRILQEFFSNTLKYAEADSLQISIRYHADGISIRAKDNGQGFDMASATKSSGLINMEKRAQMINAAYELKSSLKQGTELILDYSY